MTLPVIVLPKAEQDAQDAFDWYESQLEGLGLRFLNALDEAVERIQSHPLSNRQIDPPIRRHLLQQFPFGVFYATNDLEIVILAILHVAMNPDSWPRP